MDRASGTPHASSTTTSTTEWLGIAGSSGWPISPGILGGFWYEAMLDSVFLGFAFSMIFGHARPSFQR